MKTRSPGQVLDEIARAESATEFNLSTALHTRIRKENQNIMKRRALLYTSAALLMAVVILLSIPSVAQAVKKWFGYVPGAGMVEENSALRVLAAPVTKETANGTITVEQAVADPSHTIVTYQISNIPDSGSSELSYTDYCHELPWIKLADGTILDPQTIGGNSWASGFLRQLEFAAIPASENSVIMGFNCIEGTPKNNNQSKIELTLEFIPAPPEMTVFPVVELATPTSAPAGTPATADSESSLPISLILKKYVQTDQELILFGALQSTVDDYWVSLVDSSDVRLIDSQGSEIPLEEDLSLPDPEIQALVGQVWPLTYRVTGAYHPGEALLSVDSIWVTRSTEASFSFDLGANPQPGQTIVLNQRLTNNGHSFFIKDVTVDAQGNGLQFSFEASEGVSNLNLLDADHDLLGGGGGDASTGFTYRDALPSGEVTILLAGYDEKVAGPWLASIELPAFFGESQPTAVPEACLTNATWQTALAAPLAVTGNLQGSLVLMDLLPPMFTYHVMRADLSGVETTDLANGSNGSVSPDGRTLVFENDSGLNLMTLPGGEVTLIPGTSKRDHGPVWSPDGSLIAFTRAPASSIGGGGPGPYQLMLMNADGSGISTLLDDTQANYAQSWMPDGNNLVFTTMNADGATIKSIEVNTHAVKMLRDVNYQNAGVMVSPDGTKIAFEAMLPGDRYGVFVSNLDGSDERLVANTDPIVTTVPAWSPDGEWLAMSVHDTALDENRPTIALVNQFTCQVIPMTNLHGYVTSWR